MKLKFDFVMHWLYAIVWAILAISGFSMVGAKYGWLISIMQWRIISIEFLQGYLLY